ncbi:MAG: quinolinate synthase NadA, partial [Guyparkeria sp.]
LPNEVLIVATDRGIFHKMAEAAPGKTLIEAPTGGRSATCVSCAHCPWMAMNGLVSVRDALRHPQDHEITVDPAIRVKAVESIQRMLDFSRSRGIVTRGNNDA